MTKTAMKGELDNCRLFNCISDNISFSLESTALMEARATSTRSPVTKRAERRRMATTRAASIPTTSAKREAIRREATTAKMGDISTRMAMMSTTDTRKSPARRAAPTTIRSGDTKREERVIKSLMMFNLLM